MFGLDLIESILKIKFEIGSNPKRNSFVGFFVYSIFLFLKLFFFQFYWINLCTPLQNR